MKDLFRLVKNAYEDFHDLVDELLNEIPFDEDFFMEPLTLMTNRGPVNINPTIDLNQMVETDIELRYQLLGKKQQKLGENTTVYSIFDQDGNEYGTLIRSRTVDTDGIAEAIKKYIVNDLGETAINQEVLDDDRIEI